MSVASINVSASICCQGKISGIFGRRVVELVDDLPSLTQARQVRVEDHFLVDAADVAIRQRQQPGSEEGMKAQERLDRLSRAHGHDVAGAVADALRAAVHVGLHAGPGIPVPARAHEVDLRRVRDDGHDEVLRSEAGKSPDAKRYRGGRRSSRPKAWTVHSWRNHG
jgi:hypothetical protein